MNKILLLGIGLERESKFLIIAGICAVVFLQFFAFNNFFDNLSTFAHDLSTNQFLLLKDPFLLIFFSPIALYILYKDDHEKTSYLSLQKIFSCLFIVILVSMIFVTPFSVSGYYWPAVFAMEPESNSTNSMVDTTSSESSTIDDNSTDSSTSSSQPTNSTEDILASDPISQEEAGASAELLTSNSTSTEIDNSTSTEIDNSTSGR